MIPIYLTRFGLIVALIFLALTALPTHRANAITAEEMLADPVLEQRARALSKQLRCLVCQNQSIDDSDADLAKDLRREVRLQLDAGASDDTIIDQLRQKYGDYVLLNPPLDAATLFLWLAPIGFVALGGVIIIAARRHRHGAATGTSLNPIGLNDDEQARVKKMLAARKQKDKSGQ